MGETPKDVHSLMLGDEKVFQVLFVDYYSVKNNLKHTCHSAKMPDGFSYNSSVA